MSTYAVIPAGDTDYTQTVYGPFDSFKEADAYRSSLSADPEDWKVVGLQAPESVLDQNEADPPWA